ncbi:AMP-binding protein, partial [Flavobacterium sp. FlaQc-51]
LPDLRAFRYLMMNGEALPVEYCKKWFDYYPSVSMANVYGPTECSDDITHHIFESCLQNWTGYVPIGKPIQNMNIYILDKNLHLVPKGVTGDLYTSGAGVGKGYLNDDQKTKQVFITNPYSSSADDKVLYKTGDLAKWLADGTLDFAGRADEQVKIRGIRIELGEIETELAKSPLVKHNRIVIKEDANKSKFLVAYIVPNAEFNKESIQDFLKERLPNYMVPGFYVALDE